MLDLTKRIMPSAIEVDGIYFPIKTDFKLWLSFGNILKEKNISLRDVSFLFINQNELPTNIQSAFNKLLEFYQPKMELPRIMGGNSNIVFSYEYDSDFVYSAFMEQYGIDLIDCQMHWHKYLALFNSLHNTKLNEIIGYRSFNMNDKRTAEQQQKELKQIWELPQHLSIEDQKDLDRFNSRFE